MSQNMNYQYYAPQSSTIQAQAPNMAHQAAANFANQPIMNSRPQTPFQPAQIVQQQPQVNQATPALNYGQQPQYGMATSFPTQQRQMPQYIPQTPQVSPTQMVQPQMSAQPQMPAQPQIAMQPQMTTAHPQTPTLTPRAMVYPNHPQQQQYYPQAHMAQSAYPPGNYQFPPENQPVHGGEPHNSTQKVEQQQQQAQDGPKYEYEKEDNTYPPTNVIGQYKCSDFPSFYTGNYRSCNARKPFTMQNMRTNNPQAFYGKSGIGLHKFSKRWELRGGKFCGCFSSRTNGLQDGCLKMKCRANHRK